MLKTHTVSQGETLSSISIKYYGIASKYPLIIQSNSYLGDRTTKGRVASDGSPLIYPNDILNIPVETSNITNTLNNNTAKETINADGDEITIVVDNKKFKFFTDFNLTSSISEFDTFSVSSPYEDTELYRNTFQPLAFKDVAVYYGSDLFFNGVLLAPQSESNPDSQTLSILIYPKCGVLLDCPFPYGQYPLEFNGMDLQQIAEDSTKIFGVQVEFQGDPGAVFEKVSPEPTQKVIDFLIDLAKQRGFLITNNTQGDLLIWKPQKTTAVGNFIEGEIPFISCTPAFDPQNYYSEITGLTPATEETEASSYTWINSFLSGIIRPMVTEFNDIANEDLQTSVELMAGRMFGNSGKYSLSINTHKNTEENIFKASQYIFVNAPKSNIYRRTEFLIETCSIDRSADNGNTASFNLVIPESFSGTIPTVVPWVA